MLEPVPKGVDPPLPKSESAGLSLSLSESFAPDADPPNREPEGVVEEPKAEDVEPEVPKSEGIEVEPAGFENSELPEEEGAPKLKEEIDPLVPDDDERPKLNADFGASDVADDLTQRVWEVRS